MIVGEIIWKKSIAGRRYFKIFIRLLKNAKQKFREDEVFIGKRTCALRPEAGMDNIQLAPSPDNTFYIVFQNNLYIFNIP